MKKIVVIGTVLFIVGGCKSYSHRGSPTAAAPVFSEREYAERREAIAQQIYQSGGAASRSDARAQAQGEINQEWGNAAKAREAQAEREKFEKDLAKAMTASD